MLNFIRADVVIGINVKVCNVHVVMLMLLTKMFNFSPTKYVCFILSMCKKQMCFILSLHSVFLQLLACYKYIGLSSLWSYNDTLQYPRSTTDRSMIFLLSSSQFQTKVLYDNDALNGIVDLKCKLILHII